MIHLNAQDPTTFDRLADSKNDLRSQCSYAMSTFLFLGGQVQICRPAIAKGSEIGRLQRPVIAR
jgi:hypothetical protein